MKKSEVGMGSRIMREKKSELEEQYTTKGLFLAI